jgi:uncharacterized membrane protein YfcA
MHFDFSCWQWAMLALGAFATGLSKTGIPGLGVLTVGLFANALPARESTGTLLPLLICGDIVGVSLYRKHADWSHIWKLFPWVVPGILTGALALNRVTNSQVEQIIGFILLVMIGLQILRDRKGAGMTEVLPHSWWFAALAGFLAGLATMMANAAGPVMIIYLLAVRLPKMAFIGTSAWFFMCLNVFKVPFSAGLGLITPNSLLLDALLLLPMLPGALLGPMILKHLNQKVFEWTALALTIFAVARLLL